METNRKIQFNKIDQISIEELDILAEVYIQIE